MEKVFQTRKPHGRKNKTFYTLSKWDKQFADWEYIGHFQTGELAEEIIKTHYPETYKEKAYRITIAG